MRCLIAMSGRQESRVRTRYRSSPSPVGQDAASTTLFPDAFTTAYRRPRRCHAFYDALTIRLAAIMVMTTKAHIHALDGKLAITTKSDSPMISVMMPLPLQEGRLDDRPGRALCAPRAIFSRRHARKRKPNLKLFLAFKRNKTQCRHHTNASRRRLCATPRHAACRRCFILD